MYTVNSCTGALIATVPGTISTGINTGINAEAMVVDPAGKFLYVANLVSNATDAATISMFTINPRTGVLTPTTPAMVPTGFFPQGMAVDPSGKFLYTANSDDNTVSIFTIDSNSGVLTPATPPSIAVPPVFSSRSLMSSPDFVSADPSGRFLYVTDQDNGAVSTFAINPSTGVLTPTNPAGVVAGLNPFGVTVDSSGKFAYVPDADGNEIWMYAIYATTGILAPNPAFAVPAGTQPASVAVDPSSKFAYAVNRLDGTVSMYTIDSTTGTLTPNSPATIKTGNTPYTVVVNASGTFAYVANQNDSSLSIYSIKPNGILLSAGTVLTGNDPVAIALTH
jgi:6-phosphogluconolactonase (cycloisomerase 2 family)